MNFLSDSSYTIRQHKGMIIFWIIVCFAFVAAGQILGGPQGTYFALAIFAILVFMFKSRKDIKMVLIGLLLITALVMSFIIVKNVSAASKDASKQTEPVALEASPEVVEEPKEEQEAPQEECNTLNSFGENISQWCPLVVKYANEYGLDPILVGSIIQVESKGDPNTPSWKNAIGVMQVMPKETGWLFRDRPTADELRDPEVNIKWGNKILSDCFATYSTQIDAIQCYYGFGEGYGYAETVIPIYEEKSNQ
jgi:hypothetical protein